MWHYMQCYYQCPIINRSIEVIGFTNKWNVEALSTWMKTYFTYSEERHLSASQSFNTDLYLLLTHFLRLSIRFCTNDRMVRIQSEKDSISGPYPFFSLYTWSGLFFHIIYYCFKIKFPIETFGSLNFGPWKLPYVGVHSQWYSKHL